MTTVPYENATSGTAAREETTRLLRRMGCESVGWMDDFAKSEVLLAFSHRGRPVQLRASARGWAAMYLKANPWNARRKATPKEHEAAALRQGLIAISSIIRDWVKGSVVAVECGLMDVEGMFLPHMIGADGRTLLEVVRSGNLLPPPQDGALAKPEAGQ